jgi:hypothetical protein
MRTSTITMNCAKGRREDCAPVAGKSTLNRLELSCLEPTRYHKVSHNPIAIKRLMVDLFLEAHNRAPSEIILDLDATDDPVHGEQEGRFFHGYYDCYCYLLLYVFCGRHLLDAKLRRASLDAADGAVEAVARIVAQIRRRWPKVRILTTKRGLASPSVNSALATTRRSRLQLSRVVHLNSLKVRAGLPVRRLFASACASSPAIMPISRSFFARPNRKCTPFASHHAISKSRAKPESARTMRHA